MGKFDQLTCHFFLKCIHYYQIALSPFLGASCRFYPSCSVYTQECLSRFGLFRGGWLSAKRIVKCHPGCAGGYDPSPEKRPE